MVVRTPLEEELLSDSESDSGAAIMASTTDMEQEDAERREAQDIATPGVEDEQIAEDLNLEDIYPEPKSLFPWRPPDLGEDEQENLGRASLEPCSLFMSSSSPFSSSSSSTVLPDFAWMWKMEGNPARFGPDGMSDDQLELYMSLGLLDDHFDVRTYFPESEFAFMEDGILDLCLRLGFFQEVVDGVEGWVEEEETEDCVRARGRHPNDLQFPRDYDWEKDEKRGRRRMRK